MTFSNAPRRTHLFLLPFLVLPTLAGCAVDYVDADGDRHVIGFAAVTIPGQIPVPDIEGACARGGSVETVGLLLYRNEGGSGMAIGYADQSAVLLEACAKEKREGGDDQG